MPIFTGPFLKSSPVELKKVFNAGAISQLLETGVTSGGQAVFNFNIITPGTYVVQVSVNAPGDAANSFFVNIDAQPQDPAMIWDILPFTNGFEQRTVGWRGSGTFDNNEFTPKTLNLTAGSHRLIVVGREANTQISAVSIVKLPVSASQAPGNLQIVVQPWRFYALGGGVRRAGLLPAAAVFLSHYRVFSKAHFFFSASLKRARCVRSLIFSAEI